MALESVAELSPPREGVAPEAAMEEPPVHEVVAPEFGVKRAPPQASMALEREAIPPTIIPEATTLVAASIFPEVSATDFLRGLP